MARKRKSHTAAFKAQVALAAACYNLANYDRAAMLCQLACSLTWVSIDPTNQLVG